MATAKTITVPVPGTIAAENPPSTVTVPRAYTIDVVVEPGNSWTVDTQTYYSGWVGNVTINPSHERLAFWTIPIGANPIALQATPLATITSPVKVADQIVLQTVQPNQLQLHVAAQSPPSVDPRSTSRVAGFPSTGTIPPVPKGTDNPNPAQPSNSSPGGNNGVVIGAAIGCLIAGLLLGFLIAFFIYRKRSQRQAQYAPPPTVVESKAFDASPPLPVVDDKLSRFLLDASPVKEITSELRSLGTLIQQHVENNYHLNPVQAERRSLTALLTQLGVTSNGNGLTQEVVANLALDPRTRQVALQHVISQVLFTSIDVSSRSRLSMLPAPIAAFLQSIPPRENGERHNEGGSYMLSPKSSSTVSLTKKLNSPVHRSQSMARSLCLHPTPLPQPENTPSSIVCSCVSSGLGSGRRSGHFPSLLCR